MRKRRLSISRVDLMKRTSNHTSSASQSLTSSTTRSSHSSSFPYMSPYYSSTVTTDISSSAITETVTDTDTVTDTTESAYSDYTASSTLLYTVPYTQTYIITASTTTFTTGALTTTTETGTSSVDASPITTDYGFYRRVLNPEEGDNNRRNALIGGIIGGVAGLLLILLLFFCCKKRRSLKKAHPDIEKQKPKWNGLFRRKTHSPTEKCLNEKVGKSVTGEADNGNAVPSRENKPRFEEPVPRDEGLFNMRESLLGSQTPQSSNFQSTDQADASFQMLPLPPSEIRGMDVLYENTAESDHSRNLAMNRTKSPTRTSTYTNTKKQYSNVGLNSELLDRLRNKKPFEFQSQRIPPPRARRAVRSSRNEDDEVFDTLESTNLVRHSNTLSIDSVSSSVAFDDSETSSSSSQRSE